MIRSLEELPLEGQRVFVRVDINAPLGPDGKVSDDSRLLAVLPTIRHCVERGARVILGSHLGRPKGKTVPELSLEPVGARLAELLGQEILLTDEPVGDGARKVVSDLREGQIALLENLRFDPGEEANAEAFAQTLASYADVYINDAFGTAHRAHASTVGMVEHLTEHGAGFVMLKEIEFLSKLVGEVERPYIAVIGGAKVSGKIDVLEALLDRVDGILVGGAMANTFLKAQGIDIGASMVEDDKLPVARNFLRRAKERNVTVCLPTDVVTASHINATTGTTVTINSIRPDQMAFDIGPETIANYRQRVAAARTLFWNGPMGVFEKAPFADGTMQIAHAFAEHRRALTVLGGGDSAAAIVAAGVADQVSHLSTGGGASLEFIQGVTLPGIVALESPER